MEYGGILMFGILMELLLSVKDGVWAGRVGQRRRPCIAKGFQKVFTRWVYEARHDLWNRNLASAPGTTVTVHPRNDIINHGLKVGGTEVSRQCVNFGSYNYLGTGSESEECRAAVEKYLASPTARVASSKSYATHKPRSLAALEAKLVAFFRRDPQRDDCVVFSMGWGGNMATISAMTTRADVVISDSMNHNSIAMGCKLSHATKRKFEHNDMADLEAKLQWATRRVTQPGVSGRVFVIVEGIYSMEGDYTRLRDIVALKTRYAFLLYMDEAHSSGCMGVSGRGMCEHLGVDTAAVDVLMGTFSKSYGAMGAYIIAPTALIRAVRARSCLSYANPVMNEVLITQISAAIDVIDADTSPRGDNRLATLRHNSILFRQKLKSAGFEVGGCADSPVVPLLLYSPLVMADFSRECLRRGLAVVVVGFPATSLFGWRARFCLSAKHTQRDLEYALSVICDIGKMHGLDVWSDTSDPENCGSNDVMRVLYREFL